MTDPLDRYLDDFGRELRARRASVARPRRALRFGFAVAAAFAVVAVVLLTGTSSTPTVDAIAAARAALDPRGKDIVYLRITSTRSASRGVSAPQPGTRTTEQWSATDPPRWRFVQTIPRNRSWGLVTDGAGRRIVGRQELAFGNGAQSTYAVELGRMTIVEGLSETGPSARPPGPFGADPERTLAELLRSPRTTDLGIVRSRGRDVRRLRVLRDRGKAARSHVELIYDADPKTFAPVGGEIRVTLAPSSSRPTTFVDRFVVDEYRRIPLGESSAKLVEIQPRPGTKVKRITVEERRRRAASGRTGSPSPGGRGRPR